MEPKSLNISLHNVINMTKRVEVFSYEGFDSEEEAREFMKKTKEYFNVVEKEWFRPFVFTPFWGFPYVPVFLLEKKPDEEEPKDL